MKRIFILTLLLTPLLLSSIAFAATEPYVPMVGVPGLANVSNYTTEMYIDALYKLAITVGGILAVIQIIFGGVMYMFDGSITRKKDGKDKIKGALFGLLIILGAVLLLQTINPDLLNLKIFNNAPSIQSIKEAPLYSNLKIGDSVDIADYSLLPYQAERETRKRNNFVKGCLAKGGTIRVKAYPLVGDTYTCAAPAVEPSASLCDGYFEPTTKKCYGNKSGAIIDLGENFKDSRNDFREIECQSLGGQYNYNTKICLKKN